MEWVHRMFFSTAYAAVYRDPDDWPRDDEGSTLENFGIDDVACILFFALSIRILYFIFTQPLQKTENTSAVLAVVFAIALLIVLPHEVLVTAGWIELLFVSTCKDPNGMTSAANFAIGASAVLAVLKLCGALRITMEVPAVIVVASACVMLLAKLVLGVKDSIEEQAKADFEKAPLFTYSDGLRYYKGEPNFLVWDGGNHVFSIASLSSARVVRYDNGQTVVSFSSYVIQAEKPERLLKNCEHWFVEFTYCGDDFIDVNEPRYYRVTSSYAKEALKKIFLEARKNPR